METIIGNDVEQAAKFLRYGALVAIPTETVYGLAGNALHEATVLNIFHVKERPVFDPLIVHVKGIDDIHRYAKSIPADAEVLMQKFWPGPLTILLQKQQLIPDLVTSGLNTVALRMPAHPLTLALLNELDFPLAAPSANPFGYISPTTAQHVYDQLQGKLPYILDGGPCSVGVESTILGFENDQPVVYRIGGLPVSEIEKLIGPVSVQPNASSNPRAPGMLKSHYAPSKPLYFEKEENLALMNLSGNGALICFENFKTDLPFRQFPLSRDGNSSEAARNLFATLRELDKSDFDFICAIPFPDHGLCKAINDRLVRASSRGE
ncbi:MAG: threonylcarbamoyl-AMP synthase [Bacteroidia bacterium]|nr:threonylcarbamoyl-AMP synthase [Bacteroidia bacterium]